MKATLYTSKAVSFHAISVVVRMHLGAGGSLNILQSFIFSKRNVIPEILFQSSRKSSVLRLHRRAIGPTPTQQPTLI